MESETINTAEVQKTNVWTCVTPFSKYLALALFIILPFVGFWIGYGFEREAPMVSEIAPAELAVNTQDVVPDTATSTAAKADQLGANTYRINDTDVRVDFKLPDQYKFVYYQANPVTPTSLQAFLVSDKLKGPTDIEYGDAFLSLYIEESSTERCHYEFCILKSQAQIKTGARVWDYLGTADAGHSGIAELSNIYSTVEGNLVIYASSDYDFTRQDEESGVHAFFDTLDFVLE